MYANIGVSECVRHPKCGNAVYSPLMSYLGDKKRQTNVHTTTCRTGKNPTNIQIHDIATEQNHQPEELKNHKVIKDSNQFNFDTNLRQYIYQKVLLFYALTKGHCHFIT